MKNSGFFAIFILLFGLSPITEEPGPVNNHPPGFADSPVIISEFMVKQHKTLRDPDFGEYSGWLELHNREPRDVDISGWILSAQSAESHTRQTHTIPDGAVIAPDGYLLVWTSGRNTVEKAIHTRFTLPDAGGRIGLHGPVTAGEQQVRFTPVHFGGPEDTKGLSDDDSRGLSLAGLFFDIEEAVLWVVSDRARAVFVMDFTGRSLAAYDDGEGDLEAIALIKEEDSIYLVQ